MKILLLNYEFPPLGGGAGNAAYYLLKEFAKDKELKIDLVTASVGKYREEDFSPNIKIYYLNIGKKGSLHFQSKRELLSYSLRAYRFCQKLISKNKYDLAHAFFGIPCGYIAMKLGLPYIVSLRGSDVPFHNKRFYWLDRLIFKRLSGKVWKKAKLVVANSRGLKGSALKSAPGLDFAIIANGVDTRKFFPFPAEKSNSSTSLVLGNSNHCLRVVSVGRFIKIKGHSFLIEAVAGMADIEVILIGEGNLENELKKLAKIKKSKVKFLGSKKHSQLVPYLREADIFCLPSLNEGMSNSVLEAMACGLPVVATDTGGSSELIKNNGFIVKKASARALREAINNYLNNPELIKTHAAQSRKIAEQMSWKAAAFDYKRIYRRCLS